MKHAVLAIFVALFAGIFSVQQAAAIGAVAADEDGKRYVSANFRVEQNAIDAAIGACTDAGGKNCAQIGRTFQHEVFIHHSGGDFYGDDIIRAVQKAEQATDLSCGGLAFINCAVMRIIEASSDSRVCGDGFDFGTEFNCDRLYVPPPDPPPPPPPVRTPACGNLCNFAEAGELALVRTYLDNNPEDVNLRVNGDGETALWLAVSESEEEVALLLLERGADPDLAHDGETPLFLATDENLPDVVDAMIAVGVNVNAHNEGSGDEDGWTALHLAAATNFNNRGEILDALLAAPGIDADARNNRGHTPLFDARTPEIVDALLDAGADLEAQDNRGRTALGFDITNTKLHTQVTTYLARGADVHTTDNDGRTPLHIFMAEGAHIRFWITSRLQPLLDVPTLNVNARDGGEQTPLIAIAAVSGRTESVENGEGGALRIVQLLLERNDIQVTLEDNSGENAWDKANANGYTQIAEALEAAIMKTCVGEQTVVSGRCMDPTCTAPKGVLQNSVCRLPESHSECRNVYPDDSQPFYLASADDRCRPPESFAECDSVNMNAQYFNSGTNTCRKPTTNSDCMAIDAGLTPPRMGANAQPIATTDAVAHPDGCRPVADIADCHSLNPNEQYFDSTTNTCRKPDKDSECVAIDNGLTPQRTGTSAQPISTTDSGEPDGCRARISDDCSTDALPYFDTTDNECKVYPNAEACPDELPIYNTAATATGHCELPDTIAECLAEFENFNPLYPEGHWYAASDETTGCRLAENISECTEIFQATSRNGRIYSDMEEQRCRTVQSSAECMQLIDEGAEIQGNIYHNSVNGTCVQPINDAQCREIFGNAQPFYLSTEPDFCRPPASFADCNTLSMNAQYFVSSSETCRQPVNHNECGEIDDAINTGERVFDDDEPDKCRPLRNDGSDCAIVTPEKPFYDGTNCRKPMNNTECRGVDRTKPYFDNTLTDAVQCREYRNMGECPTAADNYLPIYDDDAETTGDCRLPRDHDDCELADNTRPLYDDTITAADKCRAPTNISDCDMLDSDAQFFANNGCRKPIDDSECRDIDSDLNRIGADAQPFHTTAAGEPDNCRPAANIADCNTLNPNEQYFDSTTSTCRKPDTNSECVAIDNGLTPQRTGATAQPIATDAASEPDGCRARISDDCSTDARFPYFNTANRMCEVYPAGQCPNELPIYNPAATATGNCELPDTIAECNAEFQASNPLYPEGHYFADGTEMTGCRLPKNNAECRDIDAGLTPPRTGANAQPIFASTGETDNCRPVQTDEDCQAEIESPNMNFVHPNEGTDIAASDCRFPTNNRECDRLDSDKPIFDDSPEEGLSDPKCRERGTKDCPEGQIVGDDGSCGLPENDMQCDALYGNAMPIHAPNEPDNCRPRNDDSDCPAGMVLGTDGTCGLPSDSPECERANTAEPVYDTTITDADKCRARIATDCAATATEPERVFVPRTENGGICRTPAAFFLSAESAGITLTMAGETYTASDCTGAEWTATIEISDNRENAAEVCLIPVMRDNAVSIIVQTALRGDLQPQLENTMTVNGCVMRASTSGGIFDAGDYTNIAAGAEFCDDTELFGAGGFPDKPAGFDETRSGGGDQIIISGTEILARVDGAIITVSRFTPSAIFGGGEDKNKIGRGVLTGAVGILYAYYLWQGNLDSHSFSPVGGYSITESGYSANVGGRLDFRIKDWSFYSLAGQTNQDGDFGDFRYESGGKYDGDFWSAEFSESVAGGTANYTFGLSADYDGGVFSSAPVYRLHSRLTDEESETRNSLNWESELIWNRWTIRPVAGFNWQNENDFGEKAEFRIDAIRKF